jgi:hypothetical protein
VSLWEDYLAEQSDVLMEGVPESLSDSIYSWLYSVAQGVAQPFTAAQQIKNKFRIDAAIPTRRRNNYLDPGAEWKLANFLMNVAYDNPSLFFVIADYMMVNGMIPSHLASSLRVILDDANHKYKVVEIAQGHSLVERVSQADLDLMSNVLGGKGIYASEFRDAFSKLYGTDPDYTSAAGEAFQSLESALKFYLGDDKGKNLGALLGWLSDHRDNWRYSVASDEQRDAEEHLIYLVDFVNKAYRKVKHGQADKKLTVEKKHAEVILRVVALLIFELENTIEIAQV